MVIGPVQSVHTVLSFCLARESGRIRARRHRARSASTRRHANMHLKIPGDLEKRLDSMDRLDQSAIGAGFSGPISLIEIGRDWTGLLPALVSGRLGKLKERGGRALGAR